MICSRLFLRVTHNIQDGMHIGTTSEYNGMTLNLMDVGMWGVANDTLWDGMSLSLIISEFGVITLSLPPLDHLAQVYLR